MSEQFTEYAIRIPGPHGPFTFAATTHLPTARQLYDQQLQQRGDDGAVEFLARQVQRSEWVPTVLPPAPPDPDGGCCDPTPALRAVITLHLPEDVL